MMKAYLFLIAVSLIAFWQQYFSDSQHLYHHSSNKVLNVTQEYSAIRINKLDRFYRQTEVHFLGVLDGSLYIAGNFDSINGKACKNIAKYDGDEWVPMGVFNKFAVINSLAYYKGELYSAGTYWGVRKWDGKNWKRAGMVPEKAEGNDVFLLANPGNVYSSLNPKSLAVYKNNLYVAGEIGPIGSDVVGAYRYVDNSWTPLEEKTITKKGWKLLFADSLRLYFCEGDYQDKEIYSWDESTVSTIKLPLPANTTLPRIIGIRSFADCTFLCTSFGVVRLGIANDDVKLMYTGRTDDVAAAPNGFTLIGTYNNRLITTDQNFNILNYQSAPVKLGKGFICVHNNKLFAVE